MTNRSTAPPPISPAPPTVPVAVVRLTLPASLVDLFEEQASAGGVSLDRLIAQRLAAAVNHTASKPLYFNDAERREMEQLMGVNFSTPREALSELRRVQGITVEDARIDLAPQLLTRLKSRAGASRTSLADYIRAEVIRALEEHVGLR